MLAASTDLGGVNELLAGGDIFSRNVIGQLFLHLFEEQPDFSENPPTFLPQLAASWEWSEDRLALTVELRDDVVWSDGEPLTAEDVRWTWRAQTDPAVAWPYAHAKEAIADVEVLAPHRFRVHFLRASSTQLTDLNEGVILPRHRWSRLDFAEWRRSGDWFVDNLVSSGPFELDSWRRGQQITLTRNRSYFDPGLPYLDRVVFRIVPRKGNQIRELLAGDVHFVEQVSPREAERIESVDGIELIRYWHRQYNFICWNLERDPFRDRLARRALTMAIDRQGIIDGLLRGFGRIATSPVISSVWAHDHRLEPWPYDPAAARRLLAGLGWRPGADGVLQRDGQRFSFVLETNAESSLRVDAAQMIQEQLRRIGVEAQVRRLEFQTLLDRGLSHDFDALLGGWTIDTSLDIKYAFHGESITEGYNLGSYSNPEVDALIDEARAQIDPAEMAERLQRIEAILHRDQPYTFLWEPRRIVATSERLRDALPNALSPLFRLERWWLAEPHSRGDAG